jgi:hypothetical protein
MPDPSPPERSAGTGAGLCDRCTHQQIVRNTRGSSFSLCRRSREDPAYPRYPRVPVLQCAGYELARGDERAP